MRPAWRKVAERAANPACAPDEISGALIPALVRDWTDGVPPDVVRGLDDVFSQQEDLFRDEKVQRLESLRPSIAGHGLGKVVLDCAIQVATTDERSSDPAVEAVSNALAVRASRGALQVEEHYCRKSSMPRAQNVRTRIEQSIEKAPLTEIARQLLKRDPGKPPRRAPKKRGLDDGVDL